MPDAGHVELEAVALRGEIKLEVAVFLGVGRQLVRPYRDLAPLEAFAHVPDRLQAGAPGGEMVERAELGLPANSENRNPGQESPCCFDFFGISYRRVFLR